MTTAEDIKLNEVKILGDEDLRLKIAELCGLGQFSIPHSVPNYPRDLNAMHEAEKVLSPSPDELEWCNGRWISFCQALCAICNSEEDERVKFALAPIHATARQRAEAFVLAMSW
jgi:hypothetical protein